MWPSHWRRPSLAWWLSVGALAAINLLLATVTVLDGGDGQTVRRVLMAINSSAPLNRTLDTHASVAAFLEDVDHNFVVITARAPATQGGIAAAKALTADANISALAFPSAELQLPLCKAKGDGECGTNIYSIWPVPACCLTTNGNISSDAQHCQTLPLRYNPAASSCTTGAAESCCQTAICRASTSQLECPASNPDMVCCKDGECCDPLASACNLDVDCTGSPPMHYCQKKTTLACCPSGSNKLWYWAGKTDEEEFFSSLSTSAPAAAPGAASPHSSSLLAAPLGSPPSLLAASPSSLPHDSTSSAPAAAPALSGCALYASLTSP